MFKNIPSFQEIIISVLAFLIAITVHEFAHARAALSAGDDTAKQAGRVSLNPLDHLDPMGTMMFLFTMLSGFGLAWGKPVPINPHRFNNPRWDILKVSIWGPFSNLITALVLTLILRFVVHPFAPGYLQLMATCIIFNLGLAFFNMIPVPPLDGSKVLSALLPIEMARRYDMATARYGMMILLVLIFTGAIGIIIVPPIMVLFRMLMKIGLGA